MKAQWITFIEKYLEPIGVMVGVGIVCFAVAYIATHFILRFW